MHQITHLMTEFYMHVSYMIYLFLEGYVKVQHM